MGSYSARHIDHRSRHRHATDPAALLSLPNPRRSHHPDLSSPGTQRRRQDRAAHSGRLLLSVPPPICLAVLSSCYRPDCLLTTSASSSRVGLLPQRIPRRPPSPSTPPFRQTGALPPADSGPPVTLPGRLVAGYASSTRLAMASCGSPRWTRSVAVPRQAVHRARIQQRRCSTPNISSSCSTRLACR